MCSAIKTVSVEVTADRTSGQSCFQFSRKQPGFADKQQFQTCEPGYACNGTATAAPSCIAEAARGDACSAGAPNPCPSNIGSPPLLCYKGKCVYAASMLGDECVEDADCSQGTCVDKLCTGSRSAGQTCGETDGDCVVGLFCDDSAAASGGTSTCKTTLALGAACNPKVSEPDTLGGSPLHGSSQCGPFALCNSAPKAPMCALKHSAATGTPVDNPELCSTGVAAPATGGGLACANARPGATAAQGSACTLPSQCQSPTDACVCTGGGKAKCLASSEGVAPALDSEHIGYLRDCMQKHACVNENFAATWPCTAEYCDNVYRWPLCQTIQNTARYINGGDTLTGDNAEAYQTIAHEAWGCPAPGLAAFGSFFAMCAINIVALALLCVTMARTKNEPKQFRRMSM